MADYGMPVHRHPEMKGNLYIEFEVEFPEGLSCETAEVRRTLICKRLLYCMQECACIESLPLQLCACAYTAYVSLILAVEAGSPSPEDPPSTGCRVR